MLHRSACMMPHQTRVLKYPAKSAILVALNILGEPRKNIFAITSNMRSQNSIAFMCEERSEMMKKDN